MYSIIKNIILNGNFKVNDLTMKIDMLWAESKLTDDERNELMQMMTDHINPATEAPELVEQYNMVANQVAELKDEVEALKTRVSTLEGTDVPTDPATPTDKIPAWEQWDGISKCYQYGAVVVHNDKYWLDVLKDMQNTWEPGSIGVDDRYWIEITKEQAEGILDGTVTIDDIIKA